VGKRNIFLSLQSQCRNLKEALAIAILKLFKEFVASPLGNSAIGIFSDVRNFKFAT
jgi:hypothetical protein